MVEAVFFRRNQSYVLSPQQLVDCSTRFCWGCQSGWPKYALDYVRDNGITDWPEYPYVGHNQTCEYNKTKMSVGAINETHIVTMLGNVASFIENLINLISLHRQRNSVEVRI